MILSNADSVPVIISRELLRIDVRLFQQTLSQNEEPMTIQSALDDYWSVWKQFVVHSVMQEDVLPPALMQSWHRCVSLGLDPYAEKGSHDASDQTPAAAVSQSILSLVRPAMEDLYQFAEGSECVIIFADADLRLIDMVGDQTVREELERLGLRIGTCWSEERLGANALALALQESFPIQLEGAMHYLAALHILYTSAAPIHDLLGQAVGVLAAIGHHEHAHPHTLSMITAAAQAISNQLQMQVWLGNANDLLSELKTILQTLPEGILLLRRDGVGSQMNSPHGTMLRLTPARMQGERVRVVVPLPTILAQALSTHQSLSDGELVFDTVHGRVSSLCTLKPLTSYRPETGLEGIETAHASSEP